MFSQFVTIWHQLSLNRKKVEKKTRKVDPLKTELNGVHGFYLVTQN
jgi:hypothetical protein